MRNITVSSTDLPYKDIVSGGRLTYSYDKRYVAEFSFAYSGNDNYARGKRFGFFPAGSLGYVISNEEFLKGNKIVDYLKLRASYGLTGIEITDLQDSRIISIIQVETIISVSRMLHRIITFRIIMPIQMLRGRKTGNLISVSMLFFFDRLSITADYFKEKRYDILTMPYDVLVLWDSSVLN